VRGASNYPPIRRARESFLSRLEAGSLINKAPAAAAPVTANTSNLAARRSKKRGLDDSDGLEELENVAWTELLEMAMANSLKDPDARLSEQLDTVKIMRMNNAAASRSKGHLPKAMRVGSSSNGSSPVLDDRASLELALANSLADPDADTSEQLDYAMKMSMEPNPGPDCGGAVGYWLRNPGRPFPESSASSSSSSSGIPPKQPRKRPRLTLGAAASSSSSSSSRPACAFKRPLVGKKTTRVTAKKRKIINFAEESSFEILESQEELAECEESSLEILESPEGPIIVPESQEL
jgi:hypothetical protein